MRRSLWLVICLACSGLTACGAETGAVELAWVFVDRDGDPIYPGGVFSIDDERDSCGLSGVVAEQGIPYDLRIELSICDPSCAAGCEADECQVAERQRFACNAARGNNPEVPASAQSYRFTVQPVLSAPTLGVECRDAAPTCLAVPAARERRVEAGLVTDLQVYQIAVDVDHQSGEPLDLEACGCA